MAEETETGTAREIDDSGRIRNPMSPATWTADEKPGPEGAPQPGVVQTEPEPKPEPTPEPPAPRPKKAA